MILQFIKRSLFLVALAHLAIELCANFMPVTYPLFIKTWGLTYTQIGVIALALGISGSLAQPLFGYLSDRWGARRMTVLSIAWIGLIMGLVGFARNYPVLLLLVLLGGLGSAAFHPAAATLASAGGGQRRGAAVSVFSVGGNLGSALSPLLVAAGLAWLDLPGTVVIIPLALLISLALQWRLYRPDRAEAAPAAAREQGPQPGRTGVNKGSALGLALVVAMVMCRSWVQVALMTYLPEWMHSQGYTLAVSSQLLALLMVAVSLGSLTGGSLSDWIGRWQVLALSMSLLGPTLWFFLGATGSWQVGLVGLIGVLLGLSFPVGVVMAQETWPRGVGLASALVMGLGFAPGGLGASVTGLVADSYSLTTGLQLLVIPPLVGIGCVLAYAALQKRSLQAARSEWVVRK